MAHGSNNSYVISKGGVVQYQCLKLTVNWKAFLWDFNQTKVSELFLVRKTQASSSSASCSEPHGFYCCNLKVPGGSLFEKWTPRIFWGFSGCWSTESVWFLIRKHAVSCFYYYIFCPFGPMRSGTPAFLPAVQRAISNIRHAM